ncbi:unnamed protein product [Bemisia tabaci]|uniref:Uncharacterized protein n=1 Tax=Bemisia tabaci TaxID=7038 RepID=A0A9P0ACV5_BEMTA|nr:unnamed protein product [Bemisia tabaci]
MSDSDITTLLTDPVNLLFEGKDAEVEGPPFPQGVRLSGEPPGSVWRNVQEADPSRGRKTSPGWADESDLEAQMAEMSFEDVEANRREEVAEAVEQRPEEMGLEEVEQGPEEKRLEAVEQRPEEMRLEAVEQGPEEKRLEAVEQRPEEMRLEAVEQQNVSVQAEPRATAEPDFPPEEAAFAASHPTLYRRIRNVTREGYILSVKTRGGDRTVYINTRGVSRCRNSGSHLFDSATFVVNTIAKTIRQTCHASGCRLGDGRSRLTRSIRRSAVNRQLKVVVSPQYLDAPGKELFLKQMRRLVKAMQTCGGAAMLNISVEGYVRDVLPMYTVWANESMEQAMADLSFETAEEVRVTQEEEEDVAVPERLEVKEGPVRQEADEDEAVSETLEVKEGPVRQEADEDEAVSETLEVKEGPVRQEADEDEAVSETLEVKEGPEAQATTPEPELPPEEAALKASHPTLYRRILNVTREGYILSVRSRGDRTIYVNTRGVNTCRNKGLHCFDSATFVINTLAQTIRQTCHSAECRLEDGRARWISEPLVFDEDDEEVVAP